MRNRCVSLLQLQRQLSVTCHLYSQIRTAHHCCSPTEQGRSFLFFSYRYVENITPQGPQQALWLRRLSFEQLPTSLIAQTYIQAQTCLQQFNKYNFNCTYFRPILEVLQHIFYLSYRNLRTAYALVPLFFRRDQIFFAFKLEKFIYFTPICSTFFASPNFSSLTSPTYDLRFVFKFTQVFIDQPATFNLLIQKLQNA